jgi:predicted RecA/RadA family phage recombinase
MKNFIQPGQVVNMTAPYARLSGEGMQVGNLFGVATKDAAAASIVPCQTEGVCELAKATGAGTAPVEGGKVYWDNTAKLTTAVVGTNLLIGHALLGATGLAPVIGDTTMRVRLTGAPV